MMKPAKYAIEIIEESMRIVFYPKLHWLRVKAERDAISGGFKRFFLPGLLLVFLAVMLGSWMFESEFGFLWRDTFIKASRKIILLLLVLFSSIMILYEVSRFFKIPISFEMARKISTYSMLPFVLLTIFTSLFPYFDLVGILAFYSLYLVYSGLNVLFKVHWKQHTSYLFILLGLLFLSYIFIALLLTKLTALIIY